MSCKTCRHARWGARTDIPERERRGWGDCLWPGPVSAAYMETHIRPGDGEGCPTFAPTQTQEGGSQP